MEVLAIYNFSHWHKLISNFNMYSYIFYFSTHEYYILLYTIVSIYFFYSFFLFIYKAIALNTFFKNVYGVRCIYRQ